MSIYKENRKKGPSLNILNNRHLQIDIRTRRRAPQYFRSSLEKIDICLES